MLPERSKQAAAGARGVCVTTATRAHGPRRQKPSRLPAPRRHATAPTESTRAVISSKRAKLFSMTSSTVSSAGPCTGKQQVGIQTNTHDDCHLPALHRQTVHGRMTATTSMQRSSSRWYEHTSRRLRPRRRAATNLAGGGGRGLRHQQHARVLLCQLSQKRHLRWCSHLLLCRLWDDKGNAAP